MSREWKPGDVLVVRGEVALVTTSSTASDVDLYVETARGRCLNMDEIPSEARPLVVINPEDREQVERLYDAYVKASGVAHFDYRVDEMQAALREFANPTPRIEEPTEDGWYAYDGGRQTMIFRLTRGQWYVTTDSGQCDPCEWGYIEQALGVWNLVRVLSEGVVTP